MLATDKDKLTRLKNKKTVGRIIHNNAAYIKNLTSNNPTKIKKGIKILNTVQVKSMLDP